MEMQVSVVVMNIFLLCLAYFGGVSAYCGNTLRNFNNINTWTSSNEMALIDIFFYSHVCISDSELSR